MINREVSLVINTPLGRSAFVDDTYIRKIALQLGIPCITTLSAATACVEGIRSMRDGISTIAALQDQHRVAVTR
jgi:carbamoyl-phosphate synthase large subunit